MSTARAKMKIVENSQLNANARSKTGKEHCTLSEIIDSPTDGGASQGYCQGCCR